MKGATVRVHSRGSVKAPGERVRMRMASMEWGRGGYGKAEGDGIVVGV